MNDVRDEALGRLMDRVALAIEAAPSDRSAEVLWRGSRRRAARLTAIGAALALFTGAVSWATLTLRAARTPVGGTITFSSPAAPWTFEYPSAWTTETTISAGPEHIVNVLRTTIVNGPMPPHASRFGPNSSGGDALNREVGDAGAIVLVERFWASGGSVSVDDHRIDGPGPFVTDAQSPGWTFRERTRCDGTACFKVLEWLGPAATEGDREAAAEVAGSVRLADVDRWTETDGVHTTLHDEARGYVVTYPATWTVADENLTPWLSQPGEILSLGTFPLRVSDHPDDGFRLFDAPVAPAALEDMRSDDAFVSLQESGRAAGFDDDRPDHFGPLACDEAIYGCRPSQDPDLPEAWRDPPFRAWWIPFLDDGRAFYLFVAIGNDASPELTQETWEVADSLSFVTADP
jgi:hypothetical protein